MQEKINSIIDWNITADNNNFNYGLEASMLAEEFSELIIALKNKDKKEAVDGLLDIFWVGIGTLHKMGIKGEDIFRAFEEIEDSNYSKFHNGECIKNDNGKILKPDTYKKPNLDFIV